MSYNIHLLPNGLRVVHMESASPVSYCGFAVNAGTRNEKVDEFGLAHFVEHLLFKGTKKRKSHHIINRMENVGGEINAYTTKEETFLYSVCLTDDYERAVELLGDLVFQSQFPASELEKEKEVVIDEINMYLDSPGELIYDEFENLVFEGCSLGHAILGSEKSLNTFTPDSCKNFVGEHYHPESMVFFSSGKTPFKKVIRLTEKYFNYSYSARKNREQGDLSSAGKMDKIRAASIVEKDLHQSHVMIGSRAYSLHDKNRLGLHLLNNILGGPGMNSRLNISLREKNGLVYNVESGISNYTDTGIFNIYFGCDKESEAKCVRLANKELKKLRENKLTTSQLTAAVKQWKGQLGIGSEHRENVTLGMGKAFLYYNRYDSLEETYRKIDTITAEQLLEIANEVFDDKQLYQLVFR